MILIFKMEFKSGELTKLEEFQADFHPTEPSLSTAKLSPKKDMLATGGDEGVVRVYSQELKPIESKS